MPALTVELTATVTLRQTVDVVAYFAALDVPAQERYRTLDLGELGMSAEWERPLAFLWPDDHDVIPISMVSHAASHARGEIDANVRVATRDDGERRFGGGSAWTEADFHALIGQVPWMASHYDEVVRRLTPEEIARIPGPNDVPLPLG